MTLESKILRLERTVFFLFIISKNNNCYEVKNNSVFCSMVEPICLNIRKIAIFFADI